jgi:uncharacterized repeat protein (TIGR03803 family)
MQATTGNFYGTAFGGGNNSNNTICFGTCGTVFKISPQGVPATLYSFCAQANCADGAWPVARLVQATDGNFYGTTSIGGAYGNSTYCSTGCGTFFKITPNGTLTTLHQFCAQPNCLDGWAYVMEVIQANDGNLYGTAMSGGAHSGGTAFKITPSGALTVLYSFCAQANCSDGTGPVGALVQATDGNFYGTAGGGGAHGFGTVFRLTPKGTLTTLYSFCAQANCADGEGPGAGLIQATDGNFYGTTESGGAHSSTPYCPSGCGTVFKLSPKGALKTLYSFCAQTNCADGQFADGTLVQATDGILYGATYYGGTTGGNCGSKGCGTLFSLAVGLHPFVETLPTSAKIGAKVIILGTNMTGASSVSFNSTAATFTVVSATEIRTTVPAGATSGKVHVKTPSRMLSSNVAFRVTP